jgi:LysR family transcriptional regulator, flagellar master operon regulator
MNIELARTFLEVVATGSFARAADRLNVTHSTVTMRIKALEEALRCRVLIRNKTGVSMTAAGMRFHRLAETLVRTWQMTRRHVSLAPGFEGILSIGADPALWDDLMFEWVCKTRRARPDVAIRCEGGSAEQLVQRLFQGWLDLCLVYTAQSRSGFSVEALFDDPLVLVSSEDRDLKVYWDPEFIEIDWDEGYRAQVEQLWGAVDETPHISVVSQSLGIRFVTEFGGSTWIPKRVFERGRFSRPLYRVHNAPVLERTAYMIYSPDALTERLPQMSAERIRESILNQLAGRESIWGARLGTPRRTPERTRSKHG